MIKAVDAYRFPTLIASTAFFLFATPLFAAEPEIEPELTSVATTTEVSAAVEDLWYDVVSISGNDIQSGDFVVSPGRAELEIAPGQTVIRPIRVTNRISDGRKFELGIEDMSGSADGSKSVVLLGDDRGPYSLRDFISFPGDTFDIDLGERAIIPVTISVPPDAEPGGYYGAVLVSTVQMPDDNGAAAMRSPIIARIATLFFVTVPGDIDTAGQVKEFAITDDKWWYEKGPINFGIVFENSGSRHLNPYGELHITNSFGEEVGFVELDPWFVLPQSLRLREVGWDRELLLGRYVATIKINRGYDDIVDERSVVFWVLPWKVVLGVFAVIFMIFFLIRAFFRTFEFKRKGT